MKKVVRILGLCALVALAITSCKKKEETAAMTFKATINQPTCDAKTHIGADNMLVWTADNTIKVFNADGEYGDFTTEDEDVVTANFNGTITPTDTYTAFYPNATVNGNDVCLQLNHQQNYVADDFGNDTYPMAAVNNGNDFEFHSPAGVLRLQFRSDHDCIVKNIKVQAEGDVLAGNLIYAYNDVTAYTVDTENSYDYVELASNGVTLAANEVTAFNIVILEGALANGFTVEVRDMGDNLITTFSTQADNTMPAETILTMPVKEVSYDLPFVVTDGADVIDHNNATINGHYTTPAGTTVTENGFYWGTSADNMTKATVATVATPMALDLTGLTPATTYYYKAYAVNESGETCGEVLQFTTEDEPIVVVNAQVQTVGHVITGTSAVFNGSLLNDGNEACTVGIQFCENANFTGGTLRTLTIAGTHNSPYDFTSSSVGGLTYNKTYYYRAFATNSAGTVYGETLNFIIDFVGNFQINDNDDRVTFASGLLWWDNDAQTFAIENDQFSYHRYLDDEPYGNVQSSFGQFCWSNEFNEHGRYAIPNQEGHGFAEWGDNEIRKPNSNDKYPANYWRTLTYAEWMHVATHHQHFVRDNYLILMPYGWQGNNINGLSWTQLQDLGAAIFPMVGGVVEYQGNVTSFSHGVSFIQWTSTISTNTGGNDPYNSAGAIWFYPENGQYVLEGVNNAYYHRFCVRLAKDVVNN